MDISLASFVRPPAFVPFTIVTCVSRDWLQTTYRWFARYVIAAILMDVNSRYLIGFFYSSTSIIVKRPTRDMSVNRFHEMYNISEKRREASGRNVV